jgi:hypothetical protein
MKHYHGIFSKKDRHQLLKEFKRKEKIKLGIECILNVTFSGAPKNM